MIIQRTPPRHPRRGPSFWLVLFVIVGVGFSIYIIQNAETARDLIIPTPTPAPTRSATEYALLAEISQDEGSFAEALDFYDQALQLDATNPEIYIRYINLLVRTGSAIAAVERGEEAIVLAPDNDAIWTAVASAYIANGDRLYDEGDPAAGDLQYARAFQAAQTAMDLNPTNAKARAYAAAGMVLQGNAEFYLEAQLLAEEALAIDSNEPLARLYYGIILTNQGFYDSAREQFQLGIQADPRMPQLYYELGYNFFGDSRTPEAILTFTEAIEVDPNFAPAYDALAHMYLQLGEDVRAEENALISISLDPNVARAHGRLGEAYMRLNKYDQAINEFSAAVGLYGEATELNARFFYLLGVAYLRAGTENCDEAVPLFQEVSDVSIAYAESAQEGLVECRRASFETDQ